jgi:hypothetical protein
MCGCGPELVFNSSRMSPDDMVKRADLVFIGVIQKHHLQEWPLFRLTKPAYDPATAKYWKALRREVRVG